MRARGTGEEARGVVVAERLGEGVKCHRGGSLKEEAPVMPNVSVVIARVWRGRREGGGHVGVEGHGRAWRRRGRRAVAVGMPDGGEAAYRASATEGAGAAGGEETVGAHHQRS
jgi:hypothetical protein